MPEFKYDKEKKELVEAFAKTKEYRDSQRNTFGRGISMGEHCLATYFPKWFQRWRDSYEWSVALFLCDWDGFISLCSAFERTEEDFWTIASPFIEYWKGKPETP